MKKKLLLLLFILCMLPSSQLQAQDKTYTVNGKIWTYRLNGGNATIVNVRNADHSSALSGEVTIPNQIGSAKVTAIGPSVFYNQTSMTKITIPEGVTTIGDNAFYQCERLTGTLYLPNITTIGNYTFYRCEHLTGTLSLPNLTTIGDYAFYYCKHLTGAPYLPNLTTIGENAFYNCYRLTGALKLPKVIAIGKAAFASCPGLSSLEVSKATIIGKAAFVDCSGLTELKLPNVTTINESAFGNCRGLIELKLPNVTTINDHAFRSCTHLARLEAPKLAIIGEWAFDECRGLTHLKLPKTLTSIATGAFSECSSLTTVTFESGTVLTNILGQVHFQYCYNLQYIDMRGVTLPPGFISSRDNPGLSLFRNVQPYTMIYLPTTVTAAEANQENFVIGNQCDKFVVYERHNDYKDGNMGCDYPILQDFTATTAEYRDRNFSGISCKTLCLPYPATLPAGMMAYTLVRRKANGRCYFTSVAKAPDGTTSLEANTPYLLRVTDGGTHTFGTENNVQVKATPATMEVQGSHDASIFFGGTTTNIDNAAAASGNYYGLYSNTWLPYKPSTPNGFVHSMRAYIRTTGGSPAKGFAIVLDDEDTATGIDTPELTEDELRSGHHTFYTLDGRQAGTDYDRLISGEIYVVKGQKFYKF
ncbi:MAG: leucine-rich repeat domain-containing protein [Hoylesella marshii]|uniref:leucine-rich repeat domain-containing protein n=1 Tax=Hoylesella marshii TaxID=189722 RepID=UPI003F9F8EFC